MKKLLNLFLFIILIGSASCSDDICDHRISSYSDVSIVGSWYEAIENEEMRYSENGTFYDKYCNTIRSAETEGRWEYDQANGKLTWSYSFMGQNMFADWTIKSLTDLELIISSELVAEHKLEKIVETYHLEVGETSKIQFASAYPSYTVKSYTSNNPRLASVDEKGEIKAEGEKGTTYIKISTDALNVWVKVVVGDDCLDLWYNYQSLMSEDFSTVRKTLGIPSIAGSDGYSYGYVMSELNDYAKELDVFLDPDTGLVQELALVLKPDVPESLILTYLKSHYYPYQTLGSEYHTTAYDIGTSKALVKYDKDDACIRFLLPENYMWPDYSDTFGMTSSQIISRFGDFYYGILPYYIIPNIYAESIYFSFDESTDKVTAYLLAIRNSVSSESLHELLSSKYNCYKSNESNTQFAYRDGDTQETSNIMVVYNISESSVICYDIKTLLKADVVTKTGNHDEVDWFCPDLFNSSKLNVLQ